MAAYRHITIQIVDSNGDDYDGTIVTARSGKSLWALAFETADRRVKALVGSGRRIETITLLEPHAQNRDA